MTQGTGAQDAGRLTPQYAMKVEKGLTVTMRDAGGDVRAVRGRYLVAADGAHSPIRHTVGIEMRDRSGVPLASL